MILSVIVVNYNTAHFINQTLRSICRSEIDIDYEIIVIDNKSTDNSVDLIKDQFPNIKLIENPDNYGFSKAVNIAARKSTGECLLLLNPDTIVKENTIADLYNSLTSNKEVEVVGARILDYDGKFQLSSRRSFPSFFTSLFHVVGLSYMFPKSRLFGRYNYTYINDMKSHEVDSVSGACMMFSRSHFNLVGGFDEDYFLFFEETDFCIKTKKIGKTILYNANAETIHYRGESMKSASFNVNDVFFNSLVTFYKKQGPWILGVAPLKPVLRCAYILKGLVTSFKTNLRLLFQSFLDFTSISFAFISSISLWYTTYYSHTLNIDTYLKHIPLLLNYFIVWVAVSSIFKIYRKGFSISKDIALVNILVFLIASTITYFVNVIAYSRVILFLIFTQTFILSLLWRYLFSFFTNYKIINSGKIVDVFFQRVAVVGSSSNMLSLIDKLKTQENIYKNIVGYIDTEKKDIDIKYLGKLDSIARISQDFNIDEIIIRESDINRVNIFNLLSKISGRSIMVKILPNSGNILLSKGLVEFIDDVSLIKLELPYLDSKHRFIKRTFDIFFSFILIILSLPVHIIYAPLFAFTENIFIKGGERINTLNYNSKSKLIQKLPYLWLILLGKLSFVGSKIIYSQNEYEDDYLVPGITGLYRLNSPSNLSDKKKYDFYYMENYSIFLDLEIIFRTISIK